MTYHCPKCDSSLVVTVLPDGYLWSCPECGYLDVDCDGVVVCPWCQAHDPLDVELAVGRFCSRVERQAALPFRLSACRKAGIDRPPNRDPPP